MNYPTQPGMPVDESTRSRDLGQLKILAIFHFIWAALSLLGIGFLFLHYYMMRTMMPAMMAPAMANQPVGAPQINQGQIMSIMMVFYAVAGGFMVLVGLLNGISGFFLQARKNRTFSLVVAGLDCLMIPLGTILGAFTLVVLLRQSVAAAYDEAAGRVP